MLRQSSATATLPTSTPQQEKSGPSLQGKQQKAPVPDIMHHYISNTQGATTTQYAYVPQPPPSPPMDESTKCSLPSISNLLGLADQGSPTSETHPQNQQVLKGEAVSAKPETRPSSSHYGGSHSQTRANFPPTPPMSTDASFDGYNSPSTRSVSQMSAVSAPHPHNYYYETTPPLEDVHHQHQRAMSHTPAARLPIHQTTPYPPPASSHYPSASAAASSYLPPHHQQPQHHHSVGPVPFYPPPQAQITSLYYQRPLPAAFPPSVAPPTMLGGPNPWQHHHYISPSAAASFPQSQDRYVCPTCNKAFSRPSSLRIHSHSHTGEKPFKCPHGGCGKAFSVRSNMKRHERGCHSFDGAAPVS